MKISVILDNYNYQSYIPEAIESILNQTYQNFELIIVDDGSSDDSQEIIKTYVTQNKNIKAVFKQNSGQASAFNSGYKIATGDIICFLDSDDYFEPNKLEEIVKAHDSGYDYVYTDNFSIDSDGNKCSDTMKRYACNGHNLFLVYYLSKYPGHVTSTISLKRALADKLFPLPNEDNWRIQADDLIVFGASMMTRSYYLDKKLTNYRIHSNNGHYGKKRDSDYLYNLLKNRNAIKDIVLTKMQISQTFLNNSYNLISEFQTHNIKDKNLFWLYMRTLWFCMNLPILNKLETSKKLYKIFKGAD